MKIFKLLVLFFTSVFFITANAIGQTNVGIGVSAQNLGVVTLGATLDVDVLIANTGPNSIASGRLRPIFQTPPSTEWLPAALQTNLPPGWTVLTNTGTQIRICNTTDIIPGATNRIFTIKVRGLTIAATSAITAQIAFGISCVNGPAIAGDNPADNFATSSVGVIAGCSLGVSGTVGTIVCNGGTTSITPSTSAASGPVEYSITAGPPFQSSTNFTVPAGTYTITAREVDNPLTCVAVTTVTVTEPPAVLLTTVNIIQPTCTVSSGLVSITSSTSGLTFSVDGGPYTTYPAVGYLLLAGTHTITAKNGNNCTSSTIDFIINAQPATPAAPVIGSVTQANCSVSSGSIELTNLPAESWTINPENVSGNTNSTSINNLIEGIYSFTVTNSSGCTSLPTLSVTINAVIGAPASPLVDIIQPSCALSTGSIIITSPTTDLIFSLNGGPYSVYPTGGYNSIFSGNHTLTVQNTNGCLSPVTNFIINAQPASPASPLVSIIQPTCTVSTATISVTSTTIGFTFSLDGAPFGNYPLQGYITGAGTHSLAVQNLSGCAPNITNNIIVSPQPATPSITALSTLITCFGGSSIITASAIGGVLPFEYSINNGLFQTTNIFSVRGGSYIVAVKDFNGCVGTTGNVLITQPALITTTAVATPIACNGSNSTLTISASGGIGAFEYSLNNGSFQSSNSFNIPAGTYTTSVRLIDNPACLTAVNTVISVVQPPILKATSKAAAISFCGGTTLVEVKAIGGRTPYSGIGNFTRGPGKWTFNVIDSNGCSTSTDIIILPPGCLELKVFPNPSYNTITVNHSAAVSSGATIQIFSTNGARVLTQNVAANSFISNINVTKLASGNYLLVYLNGDEKKETKFIKVNK